LRICGSQFQFGWVRICDEDACVATLVGAGRGTISWQLSSGWGEDILVNICVEITFLNDLSWQLW